MRAVPTVSIAASIVLGIWHLDRLVPPPEHVLRVSFDEREHAKRRGARWNNAMKAWVLCTREPLGRWASKRCAAVQAPAANVQQSGAGADGTRAVE
jgi:hypothetical protein